jgi:uncharacterized membrane protein
MKIGTATRAAALGALSGMRSTAGLTALTFPRRKRRARGRAARMLATKALRRLVPIAAAGEMIADKLPFTPDRTAPLPLVGRAVFGAIAGGIIASEERGSPVLGAALGAVTAVTVAHIAYHVRKYAHDRLSIPDMAVAGAEDALVLTIGAVMRA